MFAPQKLSEVTPALSSGLFPNAREHVRLRRRLSARSPRVWSVAGAEDGLRAGPPACAPRRGEFTEGSLGVLGFPLSLGNL